MGFGEGCNVGFGVGWDEVGFDEDGEEVGCNNGRPVGCELGCRDGCAEGCVDGRLVGCVEGLLLEGMPVGVFEVGA